MAHTPKAWKNYPDSTTPINAAGLIDLEQRLSAYADSVAGGAAPFLSAASFGAVGNGSTDDTTAIQAAIDAASAAGGGTVVFGAGTYVCAGVVVKSKVWLAGAGRGATVLKLKASSTSDVLITENFATYTGGTSTNGPSEWGVRDLTIDGNKSGAASGGYCLKAYGSAYTIDNVEFQNGKAGGVFSEWGTGGTDMEAHWVNFRVHDCDGWGIDFRGPHDSIFTNGHIFKNQTGGLKTSGNATSEQLTAVHTWGTEHDYGYYFSAPAYCVNCVAEGATTANVVLNVNFGTWIGGTVYGTNSGVETGFLIGDTTTARYWNVVGTTLWNFASGGKPLNYNQTNNNNFDVQINAGSCTQLVHGTPATADSVRILCFDNIALGADWADNRMHGRTRWYGTSTYRGVQVVALSSSDCYIELQESATRGNASSNGARIMAQDNGSGKTQLVVRFATGAIQVLATEP